MSFYEKEIKELQEAILKPDFKISDYGRISEFRDGELSIFSYTNAAVFSSSKSWNNYEKTCRGLILNNQTGEVIAKPFDKFWNLFQDGLRPHYSYNLIALMEKLDGSLGILYRKNGEYKISTRGVLNSPQSIWATNFLNQYFNLSDLDENVTLIFEIIYPENRIIVDYQNREDLVLLGAYNRKTLKELDFYSEVIPLANKYGFTLPHIYHFTSLEDVIAETGKIKNFDIEGWVLLYRTPDGNFERYKVKTDFYLEAHKVVDELSYENLLPIVSANKIDEIAPVIPEHRKERFNKMISNILNEHMIVEMDAFKLYEKFVQEKATRKDIGLYFKDANDKEKDLMSLVFLMIDKRDTSKLVDKVVLKRLDNESM